MAGIDWSTVWQPMHFTCVNSRPVFLVFWLLVYLQHTYVRRVLSLLEKGTEIPLGEGNFQNHRAEIQTQSSMTPSAVPFSELQQSSQVSCRGNRAVKSDCRSLVFCLGNVNNLEYRGWRVIILSGFTGHPDSSEAPLHHPHPTVTSLPITRLLADSCHSGDGNLLLNQKEKGERWKYHLATKFLKQRNTITGWGNGMEVKLNQHVLTWCRLYTRLHTKNSEDGKGE